MTRWVAQDLLHVILKSLQPVNLGQIFIFGLSLKFAHSFAPRCAGLPKGISHSHLVQLGCRVNQNVSLRIATAMALYSCYMHHTADNMQLGAYSKHEGAVMAMSLFQDIGFGAAASET